MDNLLTCRFFKIVDDKPFCAMYMDKRKGYIADFTYQCRKSPNVKCPIIDKK